MEGWRRRFGSGTQDGAGVSPTGAPLSAQETNPGLNIDSPAQSQAGWGSLPFRAHAVYQPPVEN